MPGTQQYHSYLRSLPLFKGFSEPEMDVLMGVCRAQDLQPGEAVFKEGQVGNACYIAVEGEIRVSIGSGPREQVLAKLPAGSLFGQVALIDGGRRSATCSAEGPATVLGIDRNEFDMMFRSGSTFAFKFVDVLTRILGGQLRNANNRLVDVASKEQQAAAPRDAADPDIQDFFKEMATTTSAMRADDFDLDDIQVVQSESDKHRVQDYKR